VLFSHRACNGKSANFFYFSKMLLAWDVLWKRWGKGTRPMKRAWMSWLVALGTLLIAVAPLAAQDDPDRDSADRGVARISVINGDVSVRRGDSGDWVAAAVNAPLVVADQIATGPNSRAEVQFDYANMIRLSSDSEVRFSDLAYHRYQVQVARGTVLYRVLRESDAQVEISTPLVSVRPAGRGAYRLTVSPDGVTEITVRSGEAEIYTPRGVERLGPGNSMLVRGAPGDPEFQMIRALEPDGFDRWSEDRDRSLERSQSYRYMSRDIYGGEDLDANGRWVYTPEYGYVWAPNVAPGWAPYRYGRWIWQDWYGWTWLSYDPWGWAPFHYGRWFYGPRFGWCWYPGPVLARHYWRPALVGFFGFGGGGIGVTVGFGNVGWVPLAPFEPFHPWYGRGFYGAYRSPVINRVNITNVNITNIYRNARVANGITAVTANDFSRGQLHNFVRVNNGELRQANLVRGQLPIAPGNESLRFSNRQPGSVPRVAENTRFFSQHPAASVQRVPFAQQQRAFQQIGRSPVSGAALPRNDARGGAIGHFEAGRSEMGNSAGGWRRIGESNPAAGQAPRARESSPAVRNDNGAWRRFSDPGTRENSGPLPRTGGDAIGRQSADGWNHLGSARQDPSRQVSPAGRSSDSSPWHRFGEPNGAVQRYSGSSGSFGRGLGRTESTPRAESPSYGRSGGSRSLGIAPPVVRERAMPRSEGYSRGGFGRIERPSGGGFSGGMSRSEMRSSGGGMPRGGGSAGGMSRGGSGGGRSGGGHRR